MLVNQLRPSVNELKIRNEKKLQAYFSFEEKQRTKCFFSKYLKTAIFSQLQKSNF